MMTDHKRYDFRFSELLLGADKIEAILGDQPPDDDGYIRNLISEILTEAENNATIRAEYSVFHNIIFLNDGRTVGINSQLFEVNKIVYGQLRRAGSIAIFLCTAGKEIGERSKKCMNERDMLKGYLYDLVGSEIVEAAADLMQDDLEKTMTTSGLRITNRYSPGYCGWDVSEQHKLFGLIPENYCRIRLTPSALMDPVKSVSGFIGIGEDVSFNPYTCNFCNFRDCTYREIRQKKNSIHRSL